MSMNFRFSGGYGECQVFRSGALCCCSNSGSAGVLLEQQWAALRASGRMPDDIGGM
jgi:hypothetical protein